MNIHEEVYQVKDKKDFIKFLRLLSEDFIVKNKEWENITISDYLESIAAWVEDNDSFFREKKNEEHLAELDWNSVAAIFFSGRFYE